MPQNGQNERDRSDEPIVRLSGVEKRFGELHVLRGLSVDFPAGRTKVVFGASGCGKSVMLKHVVGLLRPDHGEVWFDGDRIDRLPERRLKDVRLRFGFLFQNAALFDSMTVGENVAFPLTEHERLRAADRRRRAEDMLELVGLAGTADRMPMELSGGQRKRVALARAIILEPSVVLYDEPTTGLDPIRSDVINELIIKLNRELGVAGIVVTHDLTSAFKVADSMVMLSGGRVLLDGTPADFRESSDPEVRRFLAGEASPEELAPIRRHAAPEIEITARPTREEVG